MKTITANNINASLDAGRRTLITRNNTAREVVLMNLISNITIKDNDKKRSTVDGKQKGLNQDYGFSLYKTLEFSRDNTHKSSHNLQVEIICSRLV